MVFSHCTVFGQYACGANFELCEQGGEKDHLLNINEMPKHVHPHTDQTSYKNVLIDTSTSGKWGAAIGNYSSYGAQPYGPNTGAAGGNEAHNNMPPYLGQIAHIKT